ncbi:MAG: Ig-like domain-containing protein [Desulfuromonadaceae bacterium]
MRRKIIEVTTGLIILMVIALAGCGGGGGGVGGDTAAPVVSQMRPSAVALNIPTTTTVSITLNEAVDCKTINSTTFNVTAMAGPVSGTLVCSGATASFFPDAHLTYDSVYIVRLSTGVTDLAGNHLAAEYRGSFTTVAAGPGDPNNYMPFIQGSRWIFEGTDTVSGALPVKYSNSLTISGTKLVNGTTTTVLIESNPDNFGIPEDAYLVKDPNGITNYGSSDLSNTLTQQIAPYQEINSPLSSGYSYVQIHKTGLDFGEDLDSDGINETADLLSIVTVIGQNSVTVPAGTFSNCLQVNTEIQITVKASRTKTTYAFQGRDDQWYAPDIGPVKRMSVYSYPDGSSDTTTELLTGRFSVLASGLAASDSNTESPGKPAVGFDGTNFMLVTRRVVPQFDSTMIGVQVTMNGEVLRTFDLASADSGGALSSDRSAIAYGGGNYLVVFGQNGQIAGQRVTTTGQTLDGPAGFAITSTDSNSQPAVAFDGNNFLVVWGKYIGSGYDIYGALVSPAGQVLSEFPVFNATGEQISPAIAFDGTNYLVIWRDTRSGSGPAADTDIYGTRVTPVGGVLDPAGIAISTAAGYQGEPQLAFDGTNYLSVWGDGRTFANQLGQIPGVDIYGARVTAAGTVLDLSGIPINTATYMDFNGKGNPTVTFAGSNYLVSWQTGSFSIYPPAGIFAARVSTVGQVLASSAGVDGLSLSGAPSGATKYVYPVAKYGTGKTLITWLSNSELLGTSKEICGVLVPDP